MVLYLKLDTVRSKNNGDMVMLVCMPLNTNTWHNFLICIRKKYIYVLCLAIYCVDSERNANHPKYPIKRFHDHRTLSFTYSLVAYVLNNYLMGCQCPSPQVLSKETWDESQTFVDRLYARKLLWSLRRLHLWFDLFTEKDQVVMWKFRDE